MNFQNSKRIMCCLLAALILFTTVAKPIEVSATGMGTAAAVAIGVSAYIGVAGVLAGLGIGYKEGSDDYLDLVSRITEAIPTEFISLAADTYGMLNGVKYNDVAYIPQEFVEWVLDFVNSPANRIIQNVASGFSVDEDYIKYHDSMVAAELEQYAACIDAAKWCIRVATGDSSKYSYIWGSGKVTYSEDKGHAIEGPFVCYNNSNESLGILSDQTHKTGTTYLNTFFPSGVTGYSKRSMVTGTLFNVALGTIGNVFSDDVYSTWRSNSLVASVGGVVATLLPTVLGGTVVKTGSVAQTVAQAGAVADTAVIAPGKDSVDIVDAPDVAADLAGILAVIQAILAVLNRIWEAISTGVINAISAAVTGIVSAIETGVNFLATVISGIGSLVQTVVGTLADILAAVLSIAQSVAVAIAAVFIPSPGYFDAKVEALKGAFPFFNSAMDTASQLKNFLINLGSTPPIIYIDLAAGSGWYPMGGRTVFVDLTWYSAYKPTMDAVISAFLWLWFAWRLVLSLPGIIQGTSGFWGHPIAMSGGYLPSHGTVNETGLTIRK